MNNTVVAVYIKNKKLLMEKRSKSKQFYANFLMCPSGHVEEGESLNDALNREMREELGIDIIKAKYLFTIEDIDPFSKYHFSHNFMFIESYKGKIEKSREAEALIYMSYNELINARLVTIVIKLVEKLHELGLI